MRLLVLFFVSFALQAQVIVEREVSKLFPAEVDESTARKTLLNDAALEAAGQAAPELGFSKEQFQQKLTEKFSEHFNKFKEQKLAQRFGANYRESLSENDRKDFLIALEGEREAEFQRFSRSYENVRSFNIKSIVKDSADPKLWKAKIELNLDKGKLTRMFRRIVNDETRTYRKLIVNPDLVLVDLQWSDLGLESTESFLAPVRGSWLKWVEENLPATVEEGMACQDDCKEFWLKWSEFTPDETPTKVPLEYADSIWLKIDLNLKKTSQRQDQMSIGLEWQGRLVLMDVNTKRIIQTFELPREFRTFNGQSQQAVNSAMASAIYRSPLGAFVQIGKVLQDKVGLNRLSRLVIRGHKQLSDALTLVEKLKTRGASLGLEARLDTFGKDEAQLICYYRGEEKSFTDLLSGIKELKSSQSYTVVNEFTGVHHVLKLVAE